MELEIKYQGKKVNSEKIEFINRLITNHPNASRRFLSKKLCEAWNWRQANGH